MSTMSNASIYDKRIARARARMQERDISLLFVSPSSNLQYLTGILRPEPTYGGVNYHGSWMAGLFLGLDRAILTLPRMVAEFDIDVDNDTLEFRIIGENEDPVDVLKEVVDACNVTDSRVCLDQQVWSELVQQLQDILPKARWTTTDEVLAPLREIKDTEELECLKEVSELTDRIFGELLKQLQPGITEFEIASELEYLMKREGAEGNSFTTAVFAWSPELNRSLDDRLSGRVLEPGYSVSFDFGCILNGYCSDFGRSIFIGEPPSEYIRIYNLVIKAQRQAIEAARGDQVTGGQLYDIAHAVVADAGYADGWGPRPRLGHGIGLDVHEAPWPNRNGNQIIKADTVITIEPRIAVAGRFHARVEDVIHVTPAGGVSLTKFPRELYVVE